jgi:glycosyltransferase involved in cell wall biosynthesis
VVTEPLAIVDDPPVSDLIPRRPRAVILVANPAAPYSRGLRVARSLATAGYEVEIAAVAGDGQPDYERDGDITTRRYRPSGRWASLAEAPAGPPSIWRKVVVRGHRLLGRLVPPLRRFPAPTPDALRKIVFWPFPVRGWWTTLRRDLPPADLYHACGILTIGVALDLGRDARRQGRRGRVVYDVIDVILDSNNYDRVPGPILGFYKWKERRWVRRADAIVTVNDPIADHLVRTWHPAVRPTVLMNCQPRWDPPARRPDLLREASGIPPARRVVLFLGRLGRERGLDEAAEAVLRLDDAALVLLGFGPWADELRRRDADPRFSGHHFTLPPVHPDDVPAWTASADASIVAVPANSLNQRLSTPNKFWESLTAGTPIVVGRDLEVMRRIVEEEGIGATADPADPADLARALRILLESPEAERAARRERAFAAARDRYNWETAVQPYLGVVRALVSAPDEDESAAGIQ